MESRAFVPVEVRRHSLQAPWTYALLDQRQRKIADRARGGMSGRLLLSELAPVITHGRRTPLGDLQPDFPHAEFGIELQPVDRGGLATYHGPGQWVLFPVDRLENLTGNRRGIKKAIQSLLEIACAVGELYDSSAHIRGGCELGVWTQRGKFASVGIHVEDGVLLHGLAVNGFRAPQSFQGLRPCGLEPSIDYLLSDPVDSEFIHLGQKLVQIALKTFWH